MYVLLYPEERTIRDEELISWAKDVAVEGDGTVESVEDAIAILDPDHITLGNHGEPLPW